MAAPRQIHVLSCAGSGANSHSAAHAMISAPGISGKISQLCGTNGTVRQTAAHVIHATRFLPAASPDRRPPARQRAEQAQHHDGAPISADRVRRHEQRRQSWRVDRVDDFVQTAAQKVRAQVTAEVLAVIANARDCSQSQDRGHEGGSA